MNDVPQPFFVIGYHNVLVLVESTYHVKHAASMCDPTFLTCSCSQRIGF